MVTVASPTGLAVVLLAGLLPRLAVAADEPVALPTPADAVPGSPADAVPKSPPAATGLSITSDSTCPSGPAVSEALAALCPAVAWPSGLVRIQAADDTLVVDLVAETTTQRQLRVASDCGARATAVALVIATWTGELSSEAAGEPVLRRSAVTQGSEVAPTPPPLVTAAAANERELGASLLLSVADGVAPGVAIDFVQTRAPRGLGWQAGLSLPARRESAGPGGATSWTRAMASVAANGRLTVRRFVLSVGAGLAGAYTFTSGQGYPIDDGEQSLTAGLLADSRVGYSWWRLRFWTGVRCYRWLLSQSVVVETPTGARVTSIDLPSTDFQWAVGASYVFR